MEIGMEKKIQFLGKVIYAILWIALIGWFFLYITKGIDVTDQAYYLANYKYYFDSDVDVKSMGTFLTGVLGWAIYHLFPAHQVMALSICSWMMYLGSGILIYVILRKYVPKALLLLTILAGTLFSMTWVHVMNYNATSMFIQTLAICALWKGIKKESTGSFILGGFLIGINTFFRLPNILEVCFVIGIFWYYAAGRKRAAEGIKQSFYCGLGILGGWCLGGAAAWLILGMEKIVSYIFKTGNTLQSNDTSHGGANILLKLWEGGVCGVKDCIRYGSLVVLLVAVWLLYDRLKKKKGKKGKIIYILLAGVISIYAAYIGWNIETLRFLQMFAVITVGACILGAFYYRKRNTALSALCVIMTLAETVLCVGTDNGWNYQVVFVMFPLACIVFAVLQIEENKIRKTFLLVLVGILCMVFTAGLWYATHYVYRDGESQTLKYEVQAEEYEGIYTTKERAEYINELEEQLKYLDEEYLLVLGDFNIPYVISDKKPFLDRVWVDLESYPDEQFNADVKKKLEEKGEPVIILADLDKNGIYRSQEKYETVTALIAGNGYSQYYANGWYQIYIPED